MNLNRSFLPMIGILSGIICAALAVLILNEWYQVGILQNTSAYPFGGEGPTPYYYESAEMYARVTLIWGLVFIPPAILGVWSWLKQNKGLAIWSSAILLLLLILMLVHSGIGRT